MVSYLLMMAAATTAGADREQASLGQTQLSVRPPDAARFSAEAVVGAQLRLFAVWSAEPGAAARAFALASPENRKRIGSVAQFRLVLESPAYRPLIDNRGWLCGTAIDFEGTKAVLVSVIDNEGQLAAYRYLLKTAADPPAPPWTIDTVIPARPLDAPEGRHAQ